MIGGITLGPGMASKASAARPTKAARKTKSAKAEPTNAAELAQQSLAQGHVPLPPPLWMEQELPRLLQKYGAFGFHIGMKQRGGRWSRQPVMVFLTEHKGSPRQRGAPPPGGAHHAARRHSGRGAGYCRSERAADQRGTAGGRPDRLRRHVGQCP